ncbi:cytochrome c-type biogenesis protein CcmH [Cytobacillus firmus]|uniref:Cytochrome c-type biogenesis protein n=1 Tax=Cytobacillus firmus TaxID=1399 RepID=A0AA46PVP6_CYTFI|nr:cytochrome c-type biogenesis protein CcmH [Cytobacillus firmus]UYG98082.1 cytochrome c-type biogenesis protein CcmH [Cytobacillus firmus]
MGKKLKTFWYLLSLSIISLLVFIPKKGFAKGEDVSISRNDMLNVAKELHPPGCTDSMTADYCTLTTAYDLRQEIWSLLEGGMDKKQVIDYLVQKYDERILAAPTPEGFNLIAWVLPAAGVAMGAVLILFLLRKWKKGQGESSEKQGQPVSEYDVNKVQEELKNWL